MKWKLIQTDSEGVESRHGHRAVAIKDGIIFYGGGKGKICNQLHIYKILQNKNIFPMLTGKMCPGLASFGVVKMNEKLILFGGMLEHRALSNALYTFDTIKFHWSIISNVKGEIPAARLGHSFTLIDDNRIFLFGGVKNVHPNFRKELYRYLNDLYILHNLSKNKFAWEKIEITSRPLPRESHSAVLSCSQKHLIIFGGMNADCGRLGDLWFLDVEQLVWMNFEIQGIPPSPRSLHTANIIGSRMFIFGGWVKDPEDDLKYVSSNTLCCLDLEKHEWNTFELENGPKARSGHAAVVVNNRLYIFSGRNQYSPLTDCLGDFWYLEIENPTRVEKVEMTKCSTMSIEIKWDRVPNANCYLMEVRRVQDILPKTIIKFVTNNLKAAASSQETEKRKSETLILTLDAKKLKPLLPKSDNNIPQIDGCNDEVVEVEKLVVKEEMKNPVTKPANHSVIQLSNADNGWCTVGVFKNNFCTVEGYFCFTFVKERFNDTVCPQSIAFPKVSLKSNTMYAFRIFAINSCGAADSSRIVAFRTFPEGFPSMPQNCKIIGTSGGIRLAWNPLPLQELVQHYSVIIGEKCSDKSGLNFVKCLYKGIQPTCEIKNAHLKDPAFHIKEVDNEKKQFLFRIAATNDKGTGTPMTVKIDISSEMLFNLEKTV